MPDRELPLPGGGHRRVADLLHTARGVLIGSGDPAELSRAVAGWSDRVNPVTVDSFPTGPEDAGVATESVLVRPDGHVVWAAPGGGPLPEALDRWFGPARETPRTPRRPLTSAR
jgi:hypothetical protein